MRVCFACKKPRYPRTFRSAAVCRVPVAAHLCTQAVWVIRAPHSARSGCGWSSGYTRAPSVAAGPRWTFI